MISARTNSATLRLLLKGELNTGTYKGGGGGRERLPPPLNKRQSVSSVTSTYAFVGSRVQVHLVCPDTEAADGEEFRGSIQHFFGHLRLASDTQDVRVGQLG
jgi:hypothetical protein